MKSHGKITSLCLLALATSSYGSYAVEKQQVIHSKLKNQILSAQQHQSSRSDHAEHNCGTDHNGQDWKQLQKEFSKQVRSLRAEKLKNKLHKSTNVQALSSALLDESIAVDGRYYIPVVFHIYGDAYNCSNDSAKCLTDEKVAQALRLVNEDIQGLNSEDGPIAPQFQAIRENPNIEFILAKKDPDGNASTGIVRHSREQAGFGNGDAETQSLISGDSWDNFKYMNVYIMHDLHDDGKTNNSGIAWYPELAMSEAGTARVVYNGNYTGINTNHNQRSILTHEFGHWLNLIHTFEDNSCSITNQAFCESTGDRSCDTPQMSFSDIQNNGMNCLGEATNTENFMHYSDNYAMFTEVQVERMTAALHGPARSTLWSNDNLIATGLSEYVSNSDHPWDGITGLNAEVEGTILETFSGISATEGEVDTFEINIPEGSTNVLFYLDGYSQDPDLYVSSGVVPTAPLDENGEVDSNGEWVRDYRSFNGTGEAESVSVDIPKTNVPYFASVHAYSEYDNATLRVIQGDDPFLAEGSKRYTLFEQNDLWAVSEGKVYDFQFTVPDDVEKVVIVVPGKYQGPKQASGKVVYTGDLDIYVNRNKAVALGGEKTDYDCRPYSWKGVAEYCEFSEGGTFNVLIDPFKSYTKAKVQVYYETSNTGNQTPFAHTNGVTHYEAVNHGIAFSSKGSNDPDGDIVSYSWDFGDGNTSTNENPIHTYDTIGEYDVSLTVTDNLGAQGVSNAKAFITQNSPNDADLCDGCTRFYLNDEIYLSSAKGATPKTYQFEVPDAASLVVFKLPSHYSGDPDIYVSQNRAVSTDDSDCSPFSAPDQIEYCEFTSGGIYNVMIDPYLDYDSVRFRAYYDIRDDADHSAPNRLPVANAGGDYRGRPNLSVSFNGALSSDEDGSIVQYSWDFGNDVTTLGETTEHVYPFPGNYNVTLTVTDNKGATHSQTVPVEILPVGDMDGDGDVDSDDIQDLMFAIHSNDSLDPSFDINGDGVINFEDAVALRELCSYDQCSNIKPPPQAPVAVASSSVNNTQVDAQMLFSSEGSTDQYGQIVSYHWNFGDGNSSSVANPTHQYLQAGTYDVVLTVTDNDDMTATSTLRINVLHPALVNACEIDNSVNNDDLIPSEPRCIGSKKTFTFNKLDRNHKTVAITLRYAPEDSQIYFKDGGWPKIANGDFSVVSTVQGEQQCAFYVIPTDANYWGYIEVSGAPLGATIVVDYDVAGCRPLVNDIPLEAPNAVVSVENGTVNTNIQFSSANSIDTDGEIVSYAWTFGDGASSTLANPVHQYSVEGTYNVTLTVTDNDGLAASTSIDVVINLPDVIGLPPLADACATDGAAISPRTLVPGEPGCIGTKKIFNFNELKRDHQTVAITLVNAPTDSSIYFKDGGWPKISVGSYDVVSTAQGEQQCAFYNIPAETNDWGYIEISGAPEGATIVVDYDVDSCRAPAP